MPRPSSIIAAMLTVLASPVMANDSSHPTVVELYQSQGCSSCPPAIANINLLAGRSDMLALTFAVTYWDRLGWKDTFARPEFTARQSEFAQAAGRGGVATPQTIVNGRVVTNGGDREQLIAAIRKGDRGITGPAISASDGKVAIRHGTTTRPATVWLVRYDPRPLSVPIRAGENGGRTIVHRNVVRALSEIGTWNGTAINLKVPPAKDAHWRSAIIVQSGIGGPILAAARL